jgi:hypothetical protein
VFILQAKPVASTHMASIRQLDRTYLLGESRHAETYTDFVISLNGTRNRIN